MANSDFRTATSTEAQSGKVKATALWVATGLLGCLFVFSGSGKFMMPEAAEHFARWGYPDWFRVLIGMAEIGGGLLLLVPRTAFYGAAALGVIMVGAAFTHLGHGEVPRAVVPLVLLCLLVTVGYLRRPRGAT
jgi:uncharacterized membrane protein YphA (DoxX/SURF4 family)